MIAKHDPQFGGYGYQQVPKMRQQSIAGIKPCPPHPNSNKRKKSAMRLNKHYLENHGIEYTQENDNLTVGDYLDLRGTNITELPDN